jgi:hypothetical protein
MPLGFGYTAEHQITGEEFIGDLQFEIAPRLHDNCHFSAHGDFRHSSEIADSLRTPHEWGLNDGDKLLMKCDKGSRWKSASLTFSVHTVPYFQDAALFPQNREKCRPAYVHELLQLRRKKEPIPTENLLIISPVEPYSITIDWKSFGIASRSPTVEKFSPFMDVSDFENEVRARVLQLVPSLADHRLLAINGQIFTHRSETYEPILAYEWDNSIITLSKAFGSHHISTQGSMMCGAASWDIELAPGGNVPLTIEKDTDPKV